MDVVMLGEVGTLVHAAVCRLTGAYLGDPHEVADRDEPLRALVDQLTDVSARINVRCRQLGVTTPAERSRSLLGDSEGASGHCAACGEWRHHVRPRRVNGRTQLLCGLHEIAGDDR